MLKDRIKIYAQGANLLQLLAIGIVFIVLMIFVIVWPVSQYQWRFFGTVIALAGLLGLNILWVNPEPLRPTNTQAIQDWIFLVISALLVLAAVWLSGQYEVTYLLAMVCGQAGGRRGVWPAGVAFGAANLLVWLALELALQTPLPVILNFNLALATGSIFALLMVTLVKRYASQTQRAETLLDELRAAQLELEEAHQKEKDLVIAQERIRLARDIHDGLGHHLIVLIVQLQAAARLVESDHQAAAEAIQVCRSEAQTALDEVRQSVSTLRQKLVENPPLPEMLAVLVRNFRERSGLDATFEHLGVPVELAPFAQDTLYHAAQEGLTNALKHAGGAQHVSVRLCYDAKAVRLSVRDDGHEPNGVREAQLTGFGLEGLRERAGQLGGEFHSGPLPEGGFGLELCLPKEKNDQGAVG